MLYTHYYDAHMQQSAYAIQHEYWASWMTKTFSSGSTKGLSRYMMGTISFSSLRLSTSLHSKSFEGELVTMMMKTQNETCEVILFKIHSIQETFLEYGIKASI